MHKKEDSRSRNYPWKCLLPSVYTIFISHKVTHLFAFIVAPLFLFYPFNLNFHFSLLFLAFSPFLSYSCSLLHIPPPMIAACIPWRRGIFYYVVWNAMTTCYLYCKMWVIGTEGRRNKFFYLREKKEKKRRRKRAKQKGWIKEADTLRLRKKRNKMVVNRSKTKKRMKRISTRGKLGITMGFDFPFGRGVEHIRRTAVKLGLYLQYCSPWRPCWGCDAGCRCQ